MADPEDPRLVYPAAERNREPILAVLRRVLPLRARVLEVASGSGQHAAHFAGALRGLTWQPSEAEPGLLSSIRAWTRELPNVLPPVELDVCREPWPLGAIAPLDAVYNANMIHISPWQSALSLLRGAGRELSDGGVLVLYGPYKLGGRHTADSNAAFDASLRARHASWGVRDLDEVAAAALAEGLVLQERVEMPANNQTLIFRRSPRGGAAAEGDGA